MALIHKQTEAGLKEHFHDAIAKQHFSDDDLNAGREFVAAYVKYIHYVEGLHQASAGQTHSHETETKPAASKPTSHH